MYENSLENLKIVDENEALDLVAGEKDLLKELLKSFLDDKKFDLEELKFLEKQNKNQAASYIHYFKGAGSQLCNEKTFKCWADFRRCFTRKKTRRYLRT